MATSAPGRAAAYGLDEPREHDLLAALVRVLGDEEAVATWCAACRRTGVHPGGGLEPAQLERVAADLLAATIGRTAVAVRSFLVAFRTFHALEGPR